MEDNTKVNNQETDDSVEYEEVKKLPLGAFIGIGLAFGLAAGFSVGNLLIDQMFGNMQANGFALGMIFCIAAGFLGGLALGLINKVKSKK